MNIEVNGKKLKTNSLSIKELIEELKLKERVMAVALNMEIVKKEDWDTKEIKEGDRVDLLEFVGGG